MAILLTRRALTRAGLAALAGLALPRAARASSLDAGDGGDPAFRLGNEAYWHDLHRGEPAPPETPPATPPAPPLGEQVAALGLRYLGTRYVSGGATPAGWDCSGMVRWLFAQQGVSLSRTTYTQQYEGVAVDPDDLLPGDLVLFDTIRPAPGHVGLYIGGGQMVNAQNEATGTVVANIWNSYWGPRFYAARRVT